MKKKVLITIFIIIISIIFALFSFYIVNINNSTNENNIQNKDNILNENIIKEIDDKYIETIPENAKAYSDLLNDNEVLLNTDEILKYNEEIRKKADMVYDIDNISSLSKEEINNYINTYKLPNLPKYDGSTILNSSNTKDIISNRNISQIVDKDNISKGIIVKRANLRSFPTNTHFYDKKNVKDFDRLQESELHVNTPVLIIHESSDNLWYFVISPFYAGWVEKENIALTNEEDYNYFINNDKFGIITDAMIDTDDTILDMSTRLPYKGVAEEGYILVLPKKGDDGFIEKKEITIERSKAHIGYLPFTKRNVLIEAFKYEGINYSWGGMDKGVDCSSYVSNIYRTFGFMFPRNTSSQDISVGQIVYLNNKTAKQKLNIIKENPLSLLYQSGHVMLYLGQKDNKNYIIHASGSNMKVLVSELTESSSYIKSINKMILIK